MCPTEDVGASHRRVCHRRVCHRRVCHLAGECNDAVSNASVASQTLLTKCSLTVSCVFTPTRSSETEQFLVCVQGTKLIEQLVHEALFGGDSVLAAHT